MKWFRSNIKHGARLALFAFAVQFALSFGHFHTVAAQTPGASQTAAAQANIYHTSGLVAADTANQAAQPQTPASHDQDQQPGDACAICAVIALASTVLLATPPVLQLPQAVELLRLVTDAEFVHLNSVRVAFQPRAPPLS